MIILDNIRLCDYTKNSRKLNHGPIGASIKTGLCQNLAPALGPSRSGSSHSLNKVKIEHLQPMSSDMFELGILLWQILIRQKPFTTVADKKLIRCIIREFAQPHFSERVPKILKKIITSCFETSIKYQASCEEVNKRLEIIGKNPEILRSLQCYQAISKN